MSNEIYAAFMMTDFDFEPEIITLKTGIVSAKTWRAGELVAKKKEV